MNALLNATAITIQRVWRGYTARLFAITRRKGNCRKYYRLFLIRIVILNPLAVPSLTKMELSDMAHFIALMRVQEAAADEELYWETHDLARFNKNRKEWMGHIYKSITGVGKKVVLGIGRLSEDEEAKLRGIESSDGK
jgi:hypothetical protein